MKTTFVQVWKEEVLVSTSPVDAPQGQKRISDLDPDTLYSFIIVAINELGESRLEKSVSTYLGNLNISSNYLVFSILTNVYAH